MPPGWPMEPDGFKTMHGRIRPSVIRLTHSRMPVDPGGAGDRLRDQPPKTDACMHALLAPLLTMFRPLFLLHNVEGSKDHDIAQPRGENTRQSELDHAAPTGSPMDSSAGSRGGSFGFFVSEGSTAGLRGGLSLVRSGTARRGRRDAWRHNFGLPEAV
jgi:hypothetical protein